MCLVIILYPFFVFPLQLVGGVVFYGLDVLYDLYVLYVLYVLDVLCRYVFCLCCVCVYCRRCGYCVIRHVLCVVLTFYLCYLICGGLVLWLALYALCVCVTPLQVLYFVALDVLLCFVRVVQASTVWGGFIRGRSYGCIVVMSYWQWGYHTNLFAEAGPCRKQV